MLREFQGACCAVLGAASEEGAGGRGLSERAPHATPGSLELIPKAIRALLKRAEKTRNSKEREKCSYDFLGFNIYCRVCSFEPAIAVLET